MPTTRGHSRRERVHHYANAHSWMSNTRLHRNDGGPLLVRTLVTVDVGSIVHPDGTKPRPEEKQRSEDQHADAGPQVDIHSSRLTDLFVTGEPDTHHRDHQPVHADQHRNDPANVERPRTLGLL